MSQVTDKNIPVIPPSELPQGQFVIEHWVNRVMLDDEGVVSRFDKMQRAYLGELLLEKIIADSRATVVAIERAAYFASREDFEVQRVRVRHTALLAVADIEEAEVGEVTLGPENWRDGFPGIKSGIVFGGMFGDRREFERINFAGKTFWKRLS